MKRLLLPLILALVVLAPGCALTKGAFTEPTGVITEDRQKIVDTYAKVKSIYLMAVDQVARACSVGQLDEEFCLKAANVHKQAQALDLAVQAKLAVPEARLDWAAVASMVALLAGLVL